MGEYLPGNVCVEVSVIDDAAVKSLVRSVLPAASFAPQPWRALYVVPLTAAILALNASALIWSPSLCISVGIGVVVGNLYAVLMFFGHELAHGAMVRSQRMQHICLFATGLIFCLS